MSQNANTAADVIKKEYDRLNTKKTEIDSALAGQSRAIFLNESHRKRYARYTTIVFIISVALLIYLGVIALRKAVPIIPEIVGDVFLGLVFAVCFVYILYILLEISSRSNTNYDELYLQTYSPPKANPDNPDIAVAANIGDSVAELACQNQSILTNY